jgi:hypothetical protein
VAPRKKATVADRVKDRLEKFMAELEGGVDETNPKDLVGIKKPRLSLIPPAGLVYEALALQNGAIKYGAFNWREKKVQALIYVDACMRHLASWLDGEELASDSGIPHLAHAKACLGILIDAKETGNLIDDRPKPGVTAALIKKYTKV